MILVNSMDKEIEQIFFKNFGIEGKNCRNYDRLEQCCNLSTFCDSGNCPSGIGGLKYPKITDNAILQLICFLNKLHGIKGSNFCHLDVENLKQEILQDCIKIQEGLSEPVLKDFRKQVKKIFINEDK